MVDGRRFRVSTALLAGDVRRWGGGEEQVRARRACEELFLHRGRLMLSMRVAPIRGRSSVITASDRHPVLFQLSFFSFNFGYICTYYVT